ncbi:YrvL family regulatory protein [Priestia aryabhattai]|uniref:YrvL family regulatory protein n=1 Tax=Priestia aryabhattai TaxID=412384 RepID=UPI003BB48A7B
MKKFFLPNALGANSLILLSCTILIFYFLCLTLLFHVTASHYNSWWSIFLFVILFILVSLGFELLELLAIYILKMTNNQDPLLTGTIQFFSIWISIYTVDEIHKGVFLSTLEEIIFSLFFLFIDKLLDSSTKIYS